MFREAFNKVAAKSGSKTDFIDALLRERPDLAGTPAVFPPQGQKGHVVIIGDEVFKGPVRKSGESMSDYQTEIATLKSLEGAALSTAVPKITAEGKDFILFGMSRVPGVPMGYNYDQRLTQDEQRQLAKDLINFTVEFAQALPQQNGKFATHDDLYYNNIMIDPETKRLSGVIDFGIVKYKSAKEWKPVQDFQGTIFGGYLREELDRRRDELPAAVPAVFPKYVRNLFAKISF